MVSESNRPADRRSVTPRRPPSPCDARLVMTITKPPSQIHHLRVPAGRATDGRDEKVRKVLNGNYSGKSSIPQRRAMGGKRQGQSQSPRDRGGCPDNVHNTVSTLTSAKSQSPRDRGGCPDSGRDCHYYYHGKDESQSPRDRGGCPDMKDIKNIKDKSDLSQSPRDRGGCPDIITTYQ